MTCPICGKPSSAHALAAAGRELTDRCGSAAEEALERESRRPSPAWRTPTNTAPNSGTRKCPDCGQTYAVDLGHACSRPIWMRRRA